MHFRHHLATRIFCQYIQNIQFGVDVSRINISILVSLSHLKVHSLDESIAVSDHILSCPFARLQGARAK